MAPSITWSPIVYIAYIDSCPFSWPWDPMGTAKVFTMKLQTSHFFDSDSLFSLQMVFFYNKTHSFHEGHKFFFQVQTIFMSFLNILLIV